MRTFFKVMVSFSLAACMCLCASSCSGNKQTVEKPDFTIPGSNGSRTDDEPGFQLEKPAKGDEIVVIETTEGTVKIRLFPKSAPIGVANFKALVNNGYYDGIKFHRIVTGFVNQFGDPTGTGSGGESIWGEEFENEVNDNLLNLRGALSYANAGPGTNTSQLFFVQTQEVDDLTLETYCSNESVKKLYQENGGSPILDGSFSVIGQVFEGLDVIDAINVFGSDDQAGTPTKDITIKKATVEKY